MTRRPHRAVRALLVGALAAGVGLATYACPRPDFLGRPCQRDSDCVDSSLECRADVCRSAEGEGEGE